MGKTVALISLTALLLNVAATANAESDNGLKSGFSAQMTLEMLEYREHEDKTGIDGRARSKSIVAGLEGIKRGEFFFCGLKALLPLSPGSGPEEATRFGKSFQNNTLEYGWTRIDGYAGYPFKGWFNPYAGVRWSQAHQERSGFVLAGVPLDAHSVEEITSWNLLLGARGEGVFTPRLKWSYRLEYFLPLKADVTNSAVPDFHATDKDGYSLELQGGINHLYNRSMRVGLLIYGGWIHWQGSAWQTTGKTSAKWPENDTFYAGAGLKVSYDF